MKGTRLVGCCRRSILHPEARLFAPSIANRHRSSHSYALAPPHNLSSYGTTTSSSPGRLHQQTLVVEEHKDDFNSLLLALPYPKRSDVFDRRSIIASIPETTIISYEALHHAFRTVEQEPSPASTLYLTRLVISSVHDMDLEQSTLILAQAVRRLGRYHLITAIPCLLERFNTRIDQAVRDDAGVTHQQVQDSYGHMFKALFNLTLDKASEDGGSDNQPLAEAGRAGMLVLAKHFLCVLDTLPSGSTGSGLRPGANPLGWLTIKRTFTTQLGDLIVDYAQRHGHRLPSSFWLTRFIVAVQDKKNSIATDALKRMRAARRTEVNRWEFTRPSSEQWTQVESTTSSWSKKTKSRAEVIMAKMRGPFDEFVDILDPYLQGIPEDSSSVAFDTHRYAWCMLFDMAAKQPEADHGDILGLYAEMPPSAICAYTLTPVMQALMSLGHPRRAWRIWLQSLELQKEGTPGRYIDAVSLSVATKICYDLAGLDQAVELLDRHARRPHRKTPKATEVKVKIDAVNVNILLSYCVKDRSPSIAFRLWAAALPRWGVRLDGISLSMMLDTARFCELGSSSDEWVDDMSSRFKLLMDGFKFRQKESDTEEPSPFEAYDSDGFAKGGYQVLLDPKGYKWFHRYGTVRPWQYVRRTFREVILGNWPFLKDLKSPLDLPHYGNFHFLSSLFSPGQSTPHVIPPKEEDPTGPTYEFDPTALHGRIPVMDAKYPYINPLPATWHAYISLLGLCNQVDEIPLAMAWMRALGVKPSWNCMTAALTFIGEVEGPRRRVKGWYDNGDAAFVRDEEIMRRWLIDWLGDEEAVPNEDDVAVRRRFIMEQGWKLIL